MSGGFFRGTSADQDTRFSNKQAKLLKTQKFAPELDHLVDITKVKMDVIKPWIAKRVTELLGFEDEVLINFIYGLLEGKEVNGKEVQIHLTGFMEKHTGKFMKELWNLLLSAQKNASGVPQQFLDAKEEETRRKKEESDRIVNEIQKRKDKESKELVEEKLKMDGVVAYDSASEPHLMPVESRLSGALSDDEKEAGARNGFRGRNRDSGSPPADSSTSPPRGVPSRSFSKSFSKSRSYSAGRNRSRSVSGSPQSRRRSISSERIYHSPQRRSATPRRRHSPRESLSPWQKSSHSRRRSASRSRYRSPSLSRRMVRSPIRRRSPSPMQRRSPSPLLRQSPSLERRRSRLPLRRRSPSPWRHRSPSPWRRRSLSPWRHQSRSPRWRRSPSPRQYRSRTPSRRRRRRSPSTISPSPVRRRSPSPVRRRSPSPVRRRSPTPVRRRSPTPVRRRSAFVRHRSLSPVGDKSISPIRGRSPARVRHRKSPSPVRGRSASPGDWSSPSHVRRRSPPLRRKSPKLQRFLDQSPDERNRNHEQLSPTHYRSQKEKAEPSVEVCRRLDSMTSRHPISLSPQRDQTNRNARKRLPSVSPSPGKSPSYSGSPPHTKNRSQSKERSPSENPNRNADERMTFDASRSPPQNLRDQKAHIERLGTIEEEEVKHAREGKDHINKSSQRTLDHSSGVRRRDSPERSGMGHRHDDSDFRKKEKGMRSEETSIKDLPATKPPHKGSFSSNRPETSHARDDAKADKKRSSRSKDVGSSLLGKSETVLKNKIVQENDPSVKFSGSEGSAEHKAGVAEKRKHKRSSRRETESDVSSYNSEVEERKVAKRRRKLEKILRKEERRRRREERRRRREEKRANKRKRKSKDSDSLPSDIEKNGDDAIASDERVARSGFQSSEKEETESEKKRLEIELRERALQSLRAKKGISH